MTHSAEENENGDEPQQLLVVGQCDALSHSLTKGCLEPQWFSSPDELLSEVRASRGRACLLCPDVFEVLTSTEEFVSQLRRQAPFLDIIAWVPDGDAAMVREALLRGVKDVVLSPNPDELLERVTMIISEQQYRPRLLEHEHDLSDRWEFEGMLSRSQKMRDLFEICVRTATTDATVLILGETGTGKELMARAFHRRSERSRTEGRMVSINCNAVPENLIDSELFGHVRGSFTGAEEDKDGLFRAADGGTLFLDEVGSIPLQAQYRLLRVLQEGKVRPVGSDEEVDVDVRVIAATSVRLDEAVAAETFRSDLLYRLDVIRVVLPPLRERPEDILFLFGHFIRKLSEHHGLPRPEMEDSFLDAFQAYGWPGNIRQLENLTERLLLTHNGADPLTAESFTDLVAPPTENPDTNNGFGETLPNLDEPLTEFVRTTADRAEEAYLRAALQRTQGRVIKTAELARISRRTLLRKLKRLGIDRTSYRIGKSVRES